MLRSVSSALGLFICPAAVFGFIILKCKNILHCGLRHVRNASINTESPSLSPRYFSLFLPISLVHNPQSSGNLIRTSSINSRRCCRWVRVGGGGAAAGGWHWLWTDRGRQHVRTSARRVYDARVCMRVRATLSPSAN